MTVLAGAKKVEGLVTLECEVGTSFIFQSGTSSSGHTGTVAKILTNGRMETYEGNTGSASLADGDGYYKKTRAIKKNGKFNTRGFVRVYAS